MVIDIVVCYLKAKPRLGGALVIMIRIVDEMGSYGFVVLN